MFINKINGTSPNLGFKGYQYVINDVGETVMKYNYPYKFNDGEKCEIEIYKVNKTDNLNYKLNKTPIKVIELKDNGTEINLQRETNLDKDETFFLRVVRKDKDNNIIWQGADSGIKTYLENGEYVFRVNNEPINWPSEEVKITDSDGKPIKVVDNNGKETDTLRIWHRTSVLDGPDYSRFQYTLINQNGTKPIVQGPGYLAMPDTLSPGWRYKTFDEDGTGELIYDSEYQKKMEGMVKTVSNMYGGSIAGLEAKVPELKEMGIKKFFTTPIANGDNRTSHGYYNKNNMQIQDNLGSSENYDSLMKTEFKNGINHVFDATLTSEGLEGIHVRYALRWGDKAQTSRWFRMNGLKDAGLGFGVVPSEAKNLRHRLINAPYNYELQSNGTYKAVKNEAYDKNKETLLQIYDASQVTNEQLNKLDEPIDMYRELKAGKNLDITTYNDTTICYVFEINPKEYQKNINTINDLNKKEGKKIELNSPEGTIISTNMSNFHINKTSDGYVAWDDNADMIKMNYGISSYDEKELQSIVNRSEREHERNLKIRGSKEVQDMAVQVGKYWADKTKTAHIIYTLQTLGKTKSAENINKLIEAGKLPEEVRISQKAVENILNGEYNLAPKGIGDKNDITVKSLMKLPLDTLEFGDNTVGVLSTSYFSNRATTDETIGVSRFDLMKQDNPHLLDTYAKVYNRVNNLFTNELKNFAEDVIAKVNESSDEPLTDADGNYTEYGEYVMDLLGRNVAKYALLKSLAGDNFRFKMLPDGTLTYDYKNIKKATTLKALGINASNPEEEAIMLENKIRKGLKKLDKQDIENAANSIKTIIKNTDTNTFRLAEALVERSGLGLDYRLDAAKDVMDMDSVRNRDTDFNDIWTELIKFWGRYVKGVKSVNPHSYIVAEMTNVNDISADTYGASLACPYNGWTNINNPKYNGEPDAMTKFFVETGITSEAAYSYFFTELLTSFSRDFESGNNMCETHDDFKKKYDLLINSRSIDYLRNLYTFIGNHDKTRTIHGLSLDMQLFHSTLMDEGNTDERLRQHIQREKVIQVLSGAKDLASVPLELRLNVDNMNYFRTVSARAVAQSKLLMDSINEDLKGVIPDDDIELLNEALIDLTNGNYMTDKKTEKMTRIKLPQLSSIENAVREIAKLAQKNGTILTEPEIMAIINNAKSLDYNKYTVSGDFGNKDVFGEDNINHLNEILGVSENSDKYCLYTVQIARMIKQAAKNAAIESKVSNALKDFVTIYDREKISRNMDGYKMYEEFSTARKKNSYAAQDFRVALEEVFNQAEFKSGRKIANKDDIMAIVYNSITEPALKKQAMMLSFLGAMCGIPTVFSGDEYGDTGFEDKAKNPNVRNRMASRLSELERNTLMGKIMARNKKYTMEAIQQKAGIKPIQNGTSYSMDVMINGRNREELLKRIGEIKAIRDCKSVKGTDLDKRLEKELNELESGQSKIAYMMQGSDGRIAISLFNAEGIEHGNRVNYFEKFKLKTDAEREKFIRDNKIKRIESYNNPELNRDLKSKRKYNPYVPMQEKAEVDAILMGAGVTIPVGTVFYNACTNKDKTQYIVKQIKDKIGIVRADGKKIIMDGLTAKHGVMMLTNFRGRPHNNGVYTEQFNIVSNPYQKPDIQAKGKRLSIIAG